MPRKLCFLKTFTTQSLSLCTETFERAALVLILIWVALMCRCAPEGTPAARPSGHSYCCKLQKESLMSLCFRVNTILTLSHKGLT